MTDCKHDWHFTSDGTMAMRCKKCGQETGPQIVEQAAEQLAQDMMQDALTIGSAWSKGGKRIDPASVFKDHGAIHSCSYHCDRPECIKAQRDELRERLAQPEQEFIKHHGDDEGWSEWVCPDPDDYLISCCDCGLVHQAQFRVAKYAPAPSEECEVVNDPDLQAQFRMRRHAVTKPQPDSWTPEDTAHRAGGLAQPEQPEQEPVAWEDVLGAIARGWAHPENARKPIDVQLAVAIAKEIQDMYTAPPAAQRKPLTEDQIDDIWNRYCDEMGEASINDAYDIVRAIEQAHGIKGKNHG
jgi:hypothetical protein